MAEKGDLKTILLKMADLCSRSEQCEYDIIQKLYRSGLNADDRNKIINYLVDNRYIDNGRFARSYASDKCRFLSWGPYKIRMMLAAKRISSSDIRDALENISDEEWEEAVMRRARSKGKSLNIDLPDGRDVRLKLYRHLISQGFSTDLAKMALNRLAAEQKSNNED